jgi:hypothetical protein
MQLTLIGLNLTTYFPMASKLLNSRKLMIEHKSNQYLDRKQKADKYNRNKDLINRFKASAESMEFKLKTIEYLIKL